VPGDDLARATTSSLVTVAFGHREGRVGGYIREELETTLLTELRTARELLLDFGAHGDVSLACSFRFRDDQNLHWGGGVMLYGTELLVIERWTSLVTDEEIDRDLCASILDELARAGDVGPRV
jgi:hypothetical protein